MNHREDPSSVKGKKYSLIQFMANTMHDIDSDNTHLTAIIDGYSPIPIESYFPDSAASLDIYEFDVYPYIWKNWESPPVDISGVEFQAVLDELLEKYYDTLCIFLDNKIPWMSEIQTFASIFKNSGDSICSPIITGVDSTNTPWDTTGHWGNWRNNVLWNRIPSREEMRLQAFLAISRGAKGIICFTFGPSIRPADHAFFGLIDYLGNQRQKWYPAQDTSIYDESLLSQRFFFESL